MSKRDPQNFIEKCVNGDLLPDDIDDCIDEWHDSDSDLELHAYLGMTLYEYDLWLHDPDILPFIVTERAQKLQLCQTT